MQIKCRNKKCGRLMGVKEFLVYVSCHLGKSILPVLVPLLVARLKEYWEASTRDLVDESMTACANFMLLRCPGCDQTRWDPYICDSTNAKQETKKDLRVNQ